MTRRRKNAKGSTILEFSLVGIPLIFVLISTFEIGRGMWIYHTVSYAVKEGTRFAIVHGSSCSVAPNACAVTLGNVATRIRQSAGGLDPARMSLTFTAANGATTTCMLNVCLNSATRWPPAGANSPGVDDVQIAATYPFQSVMAMVWPGAGKVEVMGRYDMPASSRERIQF